MSETSGDKVRDDVLLVRQRLAAMMLGVTDRTLRRWHTAGIIKPVRIGGVVGYRLEDLKRLVRRHEISTFNEGHGAIRVGTRTETQGGRPHTQVQGGRSADEGKTMSTNICGHELTRAERETLNVVQDYMQSYSGDSHWSSNISPRGDGRSVPVDEIFPARNNQDNARRRTVTRLHQLGILQACEIELSNGLLTGKPL